MFVFIRLRWLFTFLVAVLCWNSANAQNFRVSQIAVCTVDVRQGCSEYKPPYQNLDKRRFPSGRIYFAVTLLFDSDTISFLADHEFLPVNAAVWRNSLRDDNDVFFGMMQDRWAEQASNLTSAVRDQTIYPWSTHFNIRIDGARSIEIQISATRDAFVYMGTQPARLRVTFAN